MSDKKEVTPFPRGYATKEKTWRMLIDKDVPLEALKGFLISAILAVEHQHKDIRVEDLNKVLIELTGYFVNNEVEQELTKEQIKEQINKLDKKEIK